MKLNHVTLPVANLDRAVAFYEKLGLETIVYAPPRYARLLCPGHDSTLSVEVMEGARGGSGEALIYLESSRLDQLCDALEKSGIFFDQPPTDMSYLWREARLRDPDGNHISLYSAGANRLYPPWRLRAKERRMLLEGRLARCHAVDEITIELWHRSRRDLLALFELADDSHQQIQRYIEEGELLVASSDMPVGQLLLVPTDSTTMEIKSLAVAESHQRKGIATRLVKAAVDRCREIGAERLTLSAAASSLSALRFYLSQGFRIVSVVRDAFSEEAGYSQGMLVEGLPLNDALVLELEIPSAH